MMRNTNHLRALALLPALLLGVATASDSLAAERTVIPAPAGGGEGENTLAADLVFPNTGATSSGIYETIRGGRNREEPLTLDALGKKLRSGEIGGDDVTINTEASDAGGAVAIASNGDIYAVCDLRRTDDSEGGFKVYRSQDGGDSWQSWGTWDQSDTAETFGPQLLVAEGVVDRCFLAYTHYWHGASSTIIAYSPLDSENGDWTEVWVLSDGEFEYYNPRLATDAENYSDYYIYLAAGGWAGGGGDIWFARSTNQGNSFETPYKIGSMSVPDRSYVFPEISYGLGGYLHVAWEFRHEEGAFDSAIRYRRASAFANGGLGAWDTIRAITSTSNGMDDILPLVGASLVSGDVMVVHGRRERVGEELEFRTPGLFCSFGYGENFTLSGTMSAGMEYMAFLGQNPLDETWVLGGDHDYRGGIQRAPASSPLSWSAPEYLADRDYADEIRWRGNGAALDPSRDYRAAVAFSVDFLSEEAGFYFDAEWRRDPGYPVLEEGFPLSLLHTPKSPPALVDLDGDGDLEIIYSDTISRIHARHHDGTSVTGWPVYPGRELSDGPVAIGALSFHGGPTVVAGTVDGWVVAYDPEGQVLPGWPSDIGTGSETYVSIGALGDSEPRTVVVCSGDRLTFRNRTGEIPAGAYPRTFGGRIFHAPAAIGDVDGDGISEVACTPGNQIYVVKMNQLSSVFSRFLDSDISDAVTLGDLDLDGNVEVVVPTSDGTLYALNEDGSDFPTHWPFVSNTGSELTSGVIAQCLGTFEPEVVVAARNWTVHMLWDHGAQHSNYPVNTGSNWYIRGAPIVGELVGSPDVLVGARDNKIWAWTNIGLQHPGWPRDLEQKINLSPAMADIDLDGNVEVVVLTENRMVIMDVNNPPAAANRTWPMYGYDPQRTGCADCPEEVTTAVADGIVTPTRVSFAPPMPNPSSGPAKFRFSIPVRSAVSMEIYNVQGRLVRRVHRAERDPGEHVVSWDGRDDSDRPVATGQYLARLQVRGPGVREILNRKILMMR